MKTQVDKIVKVLKSLEILSASNFKKNILMIVVEKCAQLPQPINRIRPAEMDMSVRDLFHENHAAISMEFKTWTDTHQLRSELNLDVDLGEAV